MIYHCQLLQKADRQVISKIEQQKLMFFYKWNIIIQTIMHISPTYPYKDLLLGQPQPTNHFRTSFPFSPLSTNRSNQMSRLTQISSRCHNRYQPYETKIIQYGENQGVQMIPQVRKITEYEVEVVPVQRKVKRRQYIPERGYNQQYVRHTNDGPGHQIFYGTGYRNTQPYYQYQPQIYDYLGMKYAPSEYEGYRNIPNHLQYGTSESVLSQSTGSSGFQGSPTFILPN